MFRAFTASAVSDDFDLPSSLLPPCGELQTPASVHGAAAGVHVRPQGGHRGCTGREDNDIGLAMAVSRMPKFRGVRGSAAPTYQAWTCEMAKWPRCIKHCC